MGSALVYTPELGDDPLGFETQIASSQCKLFFLGAVGFFAAAEFLVRAVGNFMVHLWSSYALLTFDVHRSLCSERVFARSHPYRIVSVSYGRASPFHGGNTGSNPVGDAKSFQSLTRESPETRGTTTVQPGFGLIMPTTLLWAARLSGLRACV